MDTDYFPPIAPPGKYAIVIASKVDLSGKFLYIRSEVLSNGRYKTSESFMRLYDLMRESPYANSAIFDDHGRQLVTSLNSRITVNDKDLKKYHYDAYATMSCSQHKTGMMISKDRMSSIQTQIEDLKKQSHEAKIDYNRHKKASDEMCKESGPLSTIPDPIQMIQEAIPPVSELPPPPPDLPGGLNPIKVALERIKSVSKTSDQEKTIYSTQVDMSDIYDCIAIHENKPKLASNCPICNRYCENKHGTMIHMRRVHESDLTFVDKVAYEIRMNSKRYNTMAELCDDVVRLYDGFKEKDKKYRPARVYWIAKYETAPGGGKTLINYIKDEAAKKDDPPMEFKTKSEASIHIGRYLRNTLKPGEYYDIVEKLF